MLHCRRIAPRANRGLSIIELLVVVSLFSIFAAAVHETVITGLRTVNAADEREDVRQQLANTLERFTREASVASTVRTAQDARFRFDGDLDGDGTVESTGEQFIDYRENSGEFTRGAQSVSTLTIIRDLTSVEYAYVDLNGSTMSTPVSGGDLDDIRVVQVTITAAQDQEVISVTGAVYLRNNS